MENEDTDVKVLKVQADKTRMPELDAFRGGAAILVVLFHFSQDKLNGFFNIGVTGVDLFFIISGFVIFLTLNRSTNWKIFLFNRLSRLLPTYWTCVTITFCLKMWIDHIGFVKSLPWYVANLTMFQLNIFKFGDLDNAYWTITIEMIFYILMMFLLQLKLVKKIRLIGFLITMFCLINGTLLRHTFPHVNAFISFRVPLVNHFPLFFAGIIFYKLMLNKAEIINYLLLAFTFFVQLCIYDNGGKSWMFFSQSSYTIILFSYYILFLVYIKWGLPFIVNKVSLYFGKISYSLYLMHSFIGMRILMPLFTVSYGINNFFALILSVSIVIFIATLINQYVEVPSMQYLRNRKLKQV